MTLSKLNIFIQNSNCRMLTNCWYTQLVIRTCQGEYLVDYWPTIIDQLRLRYGTPGSIIDNHNWATTSDFSGQTLEISVDGGPTQTVTFTVPADNIRLVSLQMAAQLDNCSVTIEDEHIKITSLSAGPQSSIVIIGGSCTIPWCPPTPGTGYKIVKLQNYCGYTRIGILPPSGTYVNHIEVDVPPGCYKIWTRVCHGANEETNKAVAIVGSGIHKCVYLLLDSPTVCGGNFIHPGMDAAINDHQFLANDLLPFIRVLGRIANKPKAALQQDLLNRLEEAYLLGNQGLIDRILAVRDYVDQLPPDCY